MRPECDVGAVFPGSILAPRGRIWIVNFNCRYSGVKEILPASVVANR
jgi:hypothetical protein